MSDEIGMFSNEWWTLPAEEKRERMRAWEAQRVRDIEAEYGPVRDDELGLSKARVPIAGDVTGRLRADGTIEPVTRAPGAPTGVAPERHRDDPRRHRDRPERP